MKKLKLFAMLLICATFILATQSYVHAAPTAVDYYIYSPIYSMTTSATVSNGSGTENVSCLDGVAREITCSVNVVGFNSSGVSVGGNGSSNTATAISVSCTASVNVSLGVTKVTANGSFKNKTRSVTAF